MSYGYHCDREGCDDWQEAESREEPFFELLQDEELVGHFCCLDCLMHWAAGNSEPTEVIVIDDEQDAE